MKKLFAMILCLMLMATGLAETVPGARLSANNITVTVGEETFSPDMTVNIDGIAGEDGAFAGFFLTVGEDKLLPVQAKLDASGVSVKLGSSQVYCFTPNWFAELSGEDSASEVLALLLTPSMIDVRQLAYGFEAFLGEQPEENFALEQAQVLSWLEGATGMQEGTLSAIVEGPVLPTLNVTRTEAGYSIDWADSEAVLTVEREAEGLVYTLSGEEEILGVRFWNGGGIEASYTYHTKSDYGYENSAICLYDFAPNESGAEYSMSMRIDDLYDEPDYWADNSVTEFSMDGTVDADGVHSAHVTYSEVCEMGPDIGADFHVTLAPAQVEDNITGQNVTTVDDYTDDSLDYLAFAVMGLMGDVEKLMSSAEIAGIMETYSALDEAAYEEWQAQIEAEEPTVEDLAFDVPQFTYIPEGFEPDGEPTVYYDGVSYAQRYIDEAGYTFTIHIQEAVGETYYYAYSQGENVNSIDETVLQYKDEGNYFHGELTENGLNTSIYSYSTTLSPEEVIAILDGRVWGE